MLRLKITLNDGQWLAIDNHGALKPLITTINKCLLDRDSKAL